MMQASPRLFGTASAIFLALWVWPSSAVPPQLPPFNVQAFEYADQTCRVYNPITDTYGLVKQSLQLGGNDMLRMVAATLNNGFQQGSDRADRTFRGYYGDADSSEIKTKYEDFLTSLDATQLSIYCDGSAFQWVTTYQEDSDGPLRGQPFQDRQPRWYLPEDRRARLEFKADNRPPRALPGPTRIS
ncbi:hypothetical protein G7Y89_g6295 [Cudoniella acicularis]|uniref:Uncharacterized protein n=1 Tax=Cudoniella acicularis TaxID=354080 RepID=A0A8H4RLL1_9HELO|nr:hypothetical protein G7Y89_g6295 [Cudoniella acicularis]